MRAKIGRRTAGLWLSFKEHGLLNSGRRSILVSRSDRKRLFHPKPQGLSPWTWFVRAFGALLAGPYTKVDKDAGLGVRLRFGVRSNECCSEQQWPQFA